MGTKKKRIKLSVKKQKKFFKKIYEESGCSRHELAKISRVSVRSFGDWVNGKTNIPLDAAERLCELFNIEFPGKKDVLVKRWKKSIRKAASKAGKACIKKHGIPGNRATRAKGGKKAIKKLENLDNNFTQRKKFKKPRKSNLLAEFVGLLLGDGSLGENRVSVYLNSKADKDYAQFVKKITKYLFGVSFKVRERKGWNVLVIYEYGVNLVKYLKKIGLEPGDKTKNQVAVPEWIKGNVGYRKSCLRGLMDTDGGIFLHRYKINEKQYQYRKLCFTNRSLPLLSFVENTLTILQLNPKPSYKLDNKKVWIYNKRGVMGYLKTVGTHNPRLRRVAPNGKAQVC